MNSIKQIYKNLVFACILTSASPARALTDDAVVSLTSIALGSFGAGSLYSWYTTERAHHKFDTACSYTRAIMALKNSTAPTDYVNATPDWYYLCAYFDALKREIMYRHKEHCDSWWFWLTDTRPDDHYYPFLRYRKLLDSFIFRLYFCRFFAFFTGGSDDVVALHHDLYALRDLIRGECYEYTQEQRTYEHEQLLYTLERKIDDVAHNL